MSENDLTLSTERLPTATVIHVVGDLDLSTVEPLDRELGLATPSEKIVLDLTECTFLDSSALRSIVVAHRMVTSAGGTLIVVAPTPATRRILDIASLGRVLDIHDSLIDAIA